MNKRILIIIIIAILILAAAAVYLIAKKDDKHSDINDFASCAQAGNPIQESYPEVCSANGRSFTNPSQVAPEPPSLN